MTALAWLLGVPAWLGAAGTQRSVRLNTNNADLNSANLGAMMNHTTETEIAAASTAERVTPADIEAEISSEHYFTAADGYRSAPCFDPNGQPTDCLPPPAPLELLTFCVLVLKNGFTVTGESACASPENFNADIGRRIAREHAVNKIWPLL